MSTDYRLLLIHVLHKIQFILNTFLSPQKKRYKQQMPQNLPGKCFSFLYNLNQCKYSNVAQEVLQSYKLTLE